MTGKIIPLELLAPARTADIGIEAIRHGADAVYIGAPAFGARAAATNSIDDIKRLVDFAHLFRAKVYVTVNTIIYQQELKLVEQMIRQFHEIGVDALIVQDVATAHQNRYVFFTHKDMSRWCSHANFPSLTSKKSMSNALE